MMYTTEGRRAFPKAPANWIGVVLWILILTACRNDYSPAPYKGSPEFVKEMNRIALLRHADAGSRILMLSLPDRLREGDVEVYLNHVLMRTTYGGARELVKSRKVWMCEYLLTGERTTGTVRIHGESFGFTLNRKETGNFWFVEVYRIKNTESYALYSGNMPRDGSGAL